MSFAYLIRSFSGLAKTTLSPHCNKTIDFGEEIWSSEMLRIVHVLKKNTGLFLQ